MQIRTWTQGFRLQCGISKRGLITNRAKVWNMEQDNLVLPLPAVYNELTFKCAKRQTFLRQRMKVFYRPLPSRDHHCILK